jgi:N-acetylglucosaminyldiphosphoundecaprenol N-acetyl-beta-D-mannosaminyltransferase
MSSASFVSAAARAPITILGVPLDNVSTAEALEVIDEMIATRRPHYAAIVNVAFLVQATEDVELRRILFDAHLVLAGEKTVVWAAGFLGNRLPEYFTAPQLVPQLLARAERKKWRVFLLGTTESGLASAVEKIQATYPTLQVTGTYSQPKQSLLEMDHAEILRQIAYAKPEVLLVAFGCPQEEKWISMNYRASGVPFTIGIGDNLDFLINPQKKNPPPPEQNGQPRWLFTRKVIQQRWQMRHGKAKSSASAPTVIPDPFGNFVIRAPARMDAVEAAAHSGEWQRAAENGRVMFDLTDTVFADSTGIGALVRLRRRTVESGHQFFLIAPPPQITTALRLMKLDEFFTIQASVAEARVLMESTAKTGPVTSGVQATELQIRWVGEVTALNAIELGAFTESELSQITPDMTVVIDLSRVAFVDSTGIGLMLRFKKNLNRRDISLTFTNAVPAVLSVIRHTRLEEYLLGNGPE